MGVGEAVTWSFLLLQKSRDIIRAIHSGGKQILGTCSPAPDLGLVLVMPTFGFSLGASQQPWEAPQDEPQREGLASLIGIWAERLRCWDTPTSEVPSSS